MQSGIILRFKMRLVEFLYFGIKKSYIEINLLKWQYQLHRPKGF